MKEKIEWFQEVLALEPGSKVFFPLAKLYVETGQMEEAIATLRFGLGRRPDFMEARLLLIELLSKEGLSEEACQEMEPLAGALKSYPAFWRNWAGSLSGDEKDLSSALSLTAAHFEGKPLRWSEVIEEGLKSLTGILRGKDEPAPRAEPVEAVVEKPAAEAEAEPQVAEAAEPAEKPVSEAAPEPKDRIRSLDLKAPDQVPGIHYVETDGIRTRTMANLLASQGDYRGALSIYEELGRSEEAARMRALIDDDAAPARSAAQTEEDGFEFDSTNKLIKTLERLAARLEARSEQQS